MTDNASAPAREEIDADTADYDEMLATLDTLLDEAVRKVESGRVYDASNERVRIKWIRVAAQVIDVRRKVRTDRDLQELTERVEQLEERGA